MNTKPTTTIPTRELVGLHNTLRDAYNRLEELANFIDPWHTTGIHSIQQAIQTIENWTDTPKPPGPINTAPGDVAARDSF